MRDALALAAITAQGLFTLSWVIGGLVQPGYSLDAQYVSELAGHPTRHPWIVQAGIVVWGLGFIALAGAVLLGVRRRPARTGIVALLLALGVTGVCTAFFQLDCPTSISLACRRAGQAGHLSWQHYAHGWTAFLASPVPLGEIGETRRPRYRWGFSGRSLATTPIPRRFYPTLRHRTSPRTRHQG